MQVDLIDRERSLLMSMMQQQVDDSRGSILCPAATPSLSTDQHRTQRVQRLVKKDAAVSDTRQSLRAANGPAANQCQNAASSGHFLQPMQESGLHQHAGSIRHHSSGMDSDVGSDISSKVRQIADGLENVQASPQCSSVDCSVGTTSQVIPQVPQGRGQINPVQDADIALHSSGHSMQEGFWQDKEKLVPNLSACIQEVKLLRACLSNTSVLAQD